MIPKILHLYGPFYLNSYGFFIALSVLLFLWLGTRDPKRRALLSNDQFMSLILLGISSAIIGGRLLYIFANWNILDHFYELFEIWNGGFSVLGSILGILFTIPWYLHQQKLKTVPILDFIAVYAPLIQSISRIGCFFAGCCYGKTTASFLGIVYSHPLSAAPQNSAVHHTQLYSSFALFCVFVLMYYLAHTINFKKGQLACLYLTLASVERFMLDFLRGDQELLMPDSIFSLNQWVALFIFIPSISCFLYRTDYTKKL